MTRTVVVNNQTQMIAAARDHLERIELADGDENAIDLELICLMYGLIDRYPNWLDPKVVQR